MSESWSTLLDLLTQTEFRTGVVLGAIALALLSFVPRSPTPTRPWGLVFVAATLTGVHFLDGRSPGLLLGIGLMATGGWLIGAGRSKTGSVTSAAAPAGWTIAVVGAVIVSREGQVDTDTWLVLATPMMAIGFGAALSAWTTRPELRWLGPLVAITAFAFWTTVPDTEDARLLLGIALPLALGTLPPVSANLTTAGSFALGGVLAWIPTLGGGARPASIVGAWACIGMIALAPIAALLWPSRTIGAPATFGLHAIVAVVAARVIGSWTEAVPAAIAVVALYAAGLAATYGLGSSERQSDVKTQT